MVYHNRMKYSVKQVSQQSGVTIRTLHHYDRIGLLTPSRKSGNRYRVYNAEDLCRLQQIMLFRELGFTLAEIGSMVKSPRFNRREVLADQLLLTYEKRKRLNRIITLIQAELVTKKGGDTMTDDKKFSALKDPIYLKHREETKNRWGDTEAYRQSLSRVGKMSKQDLERVKKEGGEITLAIAAAMKKGLAATDPAVQQEAGRFYRHLGAFYDPTPEMFAGLGEMYVTDGRFRKFYETVAPGLAGFMRDAMAAFATAKKTV